MKWLKLYDDLPYDKAMLRARKEQRSETKLKALGGNGNYERIEIRLSSYILRRKLYAVWAEVDEAKYWSRQ